MNTVLLDLSFQELLRVMVSALGCGLLIGLERERHNRKESEPSFAGLRSFTICALLGAVCFLLHLAVGILGAFSVTTFCVYSLIKQKQDIGATTELAFLMTYLIGALCVFNVPLAAGLAVVLCLILMGKQSLHYFAGNWIQHFELRDGLFLLALILIALPLMPDQAMWGTVLNPYVILKLLIMILGVQSLAHIAKRLLPNNKALMLSSLASGFVSSTATIASLGMEVRSGKAEAKSNAGAGLISCIATLLQLLIIVAGINFAWFKVLLLPCSIGIAVLLIIALMLIHSSKATMGQQATPQNDITHMDSRMFSIKEALIIVVTLTVIQAAVYGLNVVLGDSGLIIGAFFASLFEVHAAMATVVMQGTPQQMTLVYAMMIGLAAHAFSKSINAFLTGGGKYFLYFAPAQMLHMAILMAVLWMVIR